MTVYVARTPCTPTEVLRDDPHDFIAWYVLLEHGDTQYAAWSEHTADLMTRLNEECEDPSVHLSHYSPSSFPIDVYDAPPILSFVSVPMPVPTQRRQGGQVAPDRQGMLATYHAALVATRGRRLSRACVHDREEDGREPNDAARGDMRRQGP